MESIKVSANRRSESGKGAASRLRGKGQIPAVAYGKQLPAQALAVSPDALNLQREPRGRPRLGPPQQDYDCSWSHSGEGLLIARQQYEPALEQLLAIVRMDRGFEDDVGRKTMISVFDMLGDHPDVVSRWRRQLSTSLN